jgi:peptide deformylase
LGGQQNWLQLPAQKHWPIVKIITYPHPTLRHKSQPIKRVDAELKRIVEEMFELMFAARGVGLAANQVDLPIQLFVANLKGDPKEAENLVFINPVITKPKGVVEAEEGCLSIPGVHMDVRRAEKIHLSAYNLAGEEINEEISDFYARVIQHETDHLHGVLFTDRLSEQAQASIRPELEEFEIEFDSLRKTGGIPDDATLAAQRAEWERKYC